MSVIAERIDGRLVSSQCTLIVAQLFCARVRHKLCASEVVTDAECRTLEQVRRATDVFIRCLGLPLRLAQREYGAELARIAYH